jgi:lipopolysaccharide transport system ATP-binding protein
VRTTNEVLIEANHVSKKFCRSLTKSLWYGVRDICSDLNPFARNRISGSDTARLEGRLRQDEFWAVNNVSFQVRRGECLGLIGRNGAGKTTLLKMINGLIKPDSGSIKVRGRVGALIALGAGFNPILTGRENIYVNGSVLGLKKKEIDKKFADIIEFADIGDFINSPVQSYSSGMRVRLGFAIATAIEPQVLLLDEVLAVGDIAFRVKCYNRIGRLQTDAGTILVTHDLSYLSTICNRILFMSQGEGTYYQDRDEGIQRYIEEQTPDSTDEDSKPLLTFIAPLTAASIIAESEQIRHGDDLGIVVAVDSTADLDNLQLRCTASTEAGHPVLVWDSAWTGQSVHLKKGRQVIRLVLGPMNLIGGRYTFYLTFSQPGNGQLILYSHRTISFEVTNKEIYSEIQTTFGLKAINIHYGASRRQLASVALLE